MSDGPVARTGTGKLSVGDDGTGQMRLSWLHRMATGGRTNSRYESPVERHDPIFSDKYERDTLNLIGGRVAKRFEESEALQNFVRNSFLGKAIVPSDDYLPEISHHFGFQAYGIHKSIVAGTFTFGVLQHFQVGNPYIHFCASAFSASVTSGMHVFDEERTRNTFASTPLVAGRSVISEQLCPDVCQTYRNRMSRSKAQNPDLEMYGTFAENCERRHAFETQIRRDQGLPNGSLVSIPYPGVPADFPTLLNREEQSTIDPSLLVTDQGEFAQYARGFLSQNMYKRK